MQMSCVICRVDFVAKRRDAKYCSPSCARRGTQPCSVEGCERASCVARPQRLCTTHYNQVRYTAEQRWPARLVDCTWCGKTHLKHHRGTRYGGKFCTLACRDAWRAATGNNPRPPGKDRCAVPWRTCPDCGLEWFRYGNDRARCDACLVAYRLARRRPPKLSPRWVAGSCRRCGTAFVDVWLAERSAQYCSARCGKRDSKDRRRARKKDAYVEDVWRQRIFERDGWRCQLCRKMVDRTKTVPHPKAPVLDHILPLARGGTHEPRNVQCAHFLCNSIKGDRGYGEQLLLVG